MIKKLSEMEYGTNGSVTEIKRPSREINAIGIRVGKKVRMITKQPVKGPVVVVVGEMEVALGFHTASDVMVEVN
ncbi:ferrous iron transport protein A [Methanoplanus sp. FWC-SCC4]|uniref:Ferrous iron transport protein A n=1 Tax=Methanochimaera problematica TaxID=2609417 RepID=A0AA97FEV7_9EURY|nr:FeoA domain-containing protein [Methanoplanus sp. FWC-SCC4]WOF16924.1 ferrous iron transport protein A [Methanoplanus sp. FWC-SCC4]